MKKDIKSARNIQRNAYQLTINNPKEKGLTHERIKEILIKSFKTLRYFCMSDEIGENGTYHTHVYVVFTSRVRWSKVKKHFEEAHIEVARGTAESNLEYIKKTGRWEDTDKKETQVEGTFEEFGKFPVQKGKKLELQELYEMIDAGYTNAEILAINNDYIQYIDKLDKIRTMLLIEKYKAIRRIQLKVVYISGKTGTGKTRGILDEHGDAIVYRVTDYQHPFDGYACQPVICFDEFRSQLRISDMLNYMDIYSIQLPSRYSNKFACYDTLYIVSNWFLEDQYPEVQLSNPETWKAFLRRIHEVRLYNADGTIDVYDSVDKYLNRNNGFRAITEDEQIDLPFKED